MRISDEKNVRKFNLLLTEKDQSLVSKARNSWSKIQEEITSGFHDCEKATLLRLFLKVKKNLDELTQ